VRLASFNLQNFGPSKVQRPEVVAELVETLRQYSFIAVQELTDSSGRAPLELLERLNADGDDYALALSERSGRQPTDQGYREQYGFYYDARRFTQLGAGALFDDQASGYFGREPYVAPFRSDLGLEFLAITLHTRPEHALSELEHVPEVIAWASQAFADIESIVVLGDLNASCAYASSAQLDALELRQAPYAWLVPDEADTTSGPSHCAYDRIIVTESLVAHATRWGIDANVSPRASDHLPVWVEVAVQR
jgi:deoxyribonuclease-1/deoxyribonuclease-1-like protein